MFIHGVQSDKLFYLFLLGFLNKGLKKKLLFVSMEIKTVKWI